MPTEEYRVIRPPLQIAGQIVVNVNLVSAPPSTPVSQIQVIATTVVSKNRTGDEIETVNPPYALVTLLNTPAGNPVLNPFLGLQTHLQDPKCKVNLRYDSNVVSGNDKITNFTAYYSY
jgi:hypothetical protein